jgi:glycosyltransferase involved in cell wall biosynthesis
MTRHQGTAGRRQPARTAGGRVVISSYDNPGSRHYAGGGGAVVALIADRLARDFQVTVVTAGRRRATMVRGGVRYRYLPVARAGPRAGQLLFHALLPFAARRIPHDLWIESFTPPFSTSLIPLFSPAPVVGWAHNLSGQEMSSRYKLPFFLIERLGLRCYRDVVVLNPADARTVQRCSPSATVRVIPNGVDLPPLDERELGHGGHILFLGRIQVWEKGLDLLLAAYARSGAELPLVLAGAGPRREEKRLTALLGTAGPGVRWVGPVTGERKDGLLRGSAFVVLPSRSEAFGISALEGMAYGKPVVHFDVPTLDWMSGDVGVPPFDTGALATTLRELAADHGRRAGLGRAARTAARRFGRDAMAEHYLTLARQLLGPPGGAGPGGHSASLGACPRAPRPETPRGRRWHRSRERPGPIARAGPVREGRA